MTCTRKEKMSLGAFSSTDITELDHSMVAERSLACDGYERRRTSNINAVVMQRIFEAFA